MKVLTASLLLAMSSVAAASGTAPFCVYSAAGPQCYYYSVDSCRSAAATLQGMCAPNNQPEPQPQIQPMQIQQRTYQPSSPDIIGNMQRGYELGRQQRLAQQQQEEHEARMQVLQLQADALRQQQEAALPPPTHYLCPDLDDPGAYRQSDSNGLGCVPVR